MFWDGQRTIINRHIQSVISPFYFAEKKKKKKNEKRGLETEEREEKKLGAPNVQGC